MRGLCEFETGEFAESLKDLEAGLALGAANQPRNEKILRYHEALLLTRAGRFEEALKSFAVFGQQDSPNPELLVAIGLAGLRIPALPKELAGDKTDVVMSAGKAGLDFMKGNKDAAHDEFETLFQRYPTTVNAHYFYGYLLYPTDVDEGAAEFKRELDVAPLNATAEAVLAWVLVLQNRVAEALPYAEKAAAQEPNLPSVQLVLGRGLTETGNPKSGIEHLEKALSLQPGNVEIHIALAKAYSETGRKEDARRERLLCLEMTKNDTKQTLHP
jgi:tetratricopeptide (TPR) repeat protein